MCQGENRQAECLYIPPGNTESFEEPLKTGFRFGYDDRESLKMVFSGALMVQTA